MSNTSIEGKATPAVTLQSDSQATTPLTVTAQGSSSPSGISKPPESASASDSEALPIAPSRTFRETKINAALPDLGELIVDQVGRSYLRVVRPGKNAKLVRIGSSECKAMLREYFRQQGAMPGTRDLLEYMDQLRSEAEYRGTRAQVWVRVARGAQGAVVIALYDVGNTHVVITPGRWEVVEGGSQVLFYQPPTAMAMAMPNGKSDLSLLRRYIILRDVGYVMYLGWLTYTMAQPKEGSAVYVILLFIGGQGSGKTRLCKLTIRLVDPGAVGVEQLPANVVDLAISSQNAHLVAYDNLRSIKPTLSDFICGMATGASVTKRKLYTDEEQQVMRLHGPLLMNSIYPIAEQPDLAQRSLPLTLSPLPGCRVRPDSELMADFERDLPSIQAGLFDYIAQILEALPRAQVTSPARMIGFVRWLAAMEIVDGVPPDTYQSAYVDILNEGQLESIQQNVLGSAILSLVQTFAENESWSGTPSELHQYLTGRTCSNLRHPPRDWPENEIQMSKRLTGLQAALLSQGVEVVFKRGKTRTITIRKLGGQP